MKPALFFVAVVFSAVLSACSTAPPEDEFIGTWKADLEGVDSAIVEIRKDGEQIMVKLKGLRNSQELEFPATYNKEAKHLEFPFGGARKSVVQGKSVHVRVDLGGRRNIK